MSMHVDFDAAQPKKFWQDGGAVEHAVQSHVPAQPSLLLF
jgi:hypothetical protein